MKISNLTETMATPVSMPSPGQPGAKFGRSDEMLESGVGTSTAGGMAPSAKPMGKMQRRGQGSMFQGIKTSSKFANSAKAGIKEDTVNEDELSEEQLQAKQKREDIFNRAKDKELGNKPKSKDIIAKEATGRGTWDSNASDYEGDYGGSRNWGRREREDDEHHHIDRAREKQEQSGTWYVAINGKVVKDKAGQPYTFYGKAAANKAALTMQAKPFNSGKQFMLTTNPNPPEQGVAEVAPPGAKAERMVKHIKKGYAKDGKLTPKEKSIAYATTWKAHNAGKVEEDCWDGYEQIGMKKKGGKTVPNCVPKK